MREVVESIVADRKDLLEEVKKSPLKDDGRISSLCSPTTPEQDIMDKVFNSQTLEELCCPRLIFFHILVVR